MLYNTQNNKNNKGFRILLFENWLATVQSFTNMYLWSVFRHDSRKGIMVLFDLCSGPHLMGKCFGYCGDDIWKESRRQQKNFEITL